MKKILNILIIVALSFSLAINVTAKESDKVKTEVERTYQNLQNGDIQDNSLFVRAFQKTERRRIPTIFRRFSAGLGAFVKRERPRKPVFPGCRAALFHIYEEKIFPPRRNILWLNENSSPAGWGSCFFPPDAPSASVTCGAFLSSRANTVARSFLSRILCFFSAWGCLFSSWNLPWGAPPGETCPGPSGN